MNAKRLSVSQDELNTLYWSLTADKHKLENLVYHHDQDVSNGAVISKQKVEALLRKVDSKRDI